MEFSRQKYWSEFPFPTRGDLPDSGIKPTSLPSPVLADGFFTTEPSMMATILYHLWRPLQFMKCLLWLRYWILHSNPVCEVRTIFISPKSPMRTWVSGTGLRPLSWNKGSTTGPAGQVDISNYRRVRLNKTDLCPLISVPPFQVAKDIFR